jgi:hypothetical protein
MNSLIEIEKERETKLKSAKIEDGFYNIIGGQRLGPALFSLMLIQIKLRRVCSTACFC